MIPRAKQFLSALAGFLIVILVASPQAQQSPHLATASSATVTWSAPNTWRSGANNAFPDGPDHKLVSGYLDTGNTAANGGAINVNGGSVLCG